MKGHENADVLIELLDGSSFANMKFDWLKQVSNEMGPNTAFYVATRTSKKCISVLKYAY